MNIRLELRATEKMGRKGRIYEVAFNGEAIASGVSPEFAACRVLKDRGFTGTAYFHRPGKATHDMRMGIEWGASHTVTEPDRGTVRFVKWAPNPMFAGKDEDIDEAA
jgi:hypothetical protein